MFSTPKSRVRWLTALFLLVVAVSATTAKAAPLQMNPNQVTPAPLLADLVAGPTCVSDNQATSFTWEFGNTTGKSLNVMVWFWGIGPGAGINKGGPSYDVDVARSGLHQNIAQTAYWAFRIPPNGKIDKTVYFNSVWPNPFENWDPTNGSPPPAAQQRFYFGGFAGIRYTTIQKQLEAEPVYCTH